MLCGTNLLALSIWHAVRTELSWTHYRTLLRVTSKEAREWYVNESALQNWSARALDRQIGTLYFERLLLSGDKASMEAEAEANIAALPRNPQIQNILQCYGMLRVGIREFT